MTPERSQRLEQLFFGGRGMPRWEREAFLERECADDEDLRREVGRVLDWFEPDTTVSLDPELESVARTLDERRSAVLREEGQRIGPYRVLDEVGQGGFGVVYRAVQEEPIRREVALKIVKPGMDTRQVIARFRAERQALALMEHPNIARVFDAGATDSGRPYFAMEFVHGIPITEYCDKFRLDVDERLRLFRTVCKAVNHAHGKGIMHRDLKPSNIMVTTGEGKPSPKIIDFGISKATNQQLHASSLHTHLGHFVGTPQYTSPEQSEAAGDVDTRTDIFSLGTVLHELLTGVTPIDADDVRGKGYAELQRLVRDAEPPPPSQRVKDGDSESAAHDRRSTPRLLRRKLRGDLDAILQKMLEKDRTRRYATASDVAADIKRYLTGAQVKARAPSLFYRLKKRVVRQRVVFASLTGLVVISLAGPGWMLQNFFQEAAINVRLIRELAGIRFQLADAHLGLEEAIVSQTVGASEQGADERDVWTEVSAASVSRFEELAGTDTGTHGERDIAVYDQLRSFAGGTQALATIALDLRLLDQLGDLRLALADAGSWSAFLADRADDEAATADYAELLAESGGGWDALREAHPGPKAWLPGASMDDSFDERYRVVHRRLDTLLEQLEDGRLEDLKMVALKAVSLNLVILVAGLVGLWFAGRARPA